MIFLFSLSLSFRFEIRVRVQVRVRVWISNNERGRKMNARMKPPKSKHTHLWREKIFSHVSLSIFLSSLLKFFFSLSNIKYGKYKNIYLNQVMATLSLSFSLEFERASISKTHFRKSLSFSLSLFTNLPNTYIS